MKYNKKSKKKIILILAASVLYFFSAASQSNEMKFTIIEPNKPEIIFGNAYRIYADGEITSKSSIELEKIILDYKIPPRSIVYFNSNGGNVFGGIELGRTIRRYGLYSYVGKLEKQSTSTNNNVINIRDIRSSSGYCLSACVLSYLGGEFRFIVKNSILGVHRFYSKSSALDADITQIASSIIIKYITSMGVNEGLFHEMVKSSKDEINVLPHAVATELNLIDSGYGKPVWTFENIKDLIYLKAERRTWRGPNKFLMICDSRNKGIHFGFLFDSEGRGDEILQMKNISIFTNSTPVALDKSIELSISIENGITNIYFNPTRKIINTILNSVTTGISMQYSYDSPVFMGFDGMDLSEGKDKIRSLKNLCLIS